MSFRKVGLVVANDINNLKIKNPNTKQHLTEALSPTALIIKRIREQNDIRLKDKAKEERSPINSSSKEKFIKHKPELAKIVKSTSCALLIQLIEYRFKIEPDGFYQSISPSKGSRKGQSLVESLNLSARQVIRITNKLFKKYPSKTLYQKAFKELGEELVFDGMPYLLYNDHNKHKTFLMRNSRVVDDLFPTLSCKVSSVDKSVDKSVDNLCITSKMSLVVSDKMSLVEAEKPIKNKALQTAKNYYNKNINSLNGFNGTFNERSEETKQPEEENLKKDLLNTEQPLKPLPFVDIGTLTELIKIFEVLTESEVKTHSSSIITNLKMAFIYKFQLSKDNWIKYCEKIASSKFLMSETKHNFKITLGFACSDECIRKINNGDFTTGDRKYMLYLEIKPIYDVDKDIEKFRHACLERMKKNMYKSWVEPLVIKKSFTGEMICTAPNSWFANHIAKNDFLGFGYLIKSLGIPAVIIKTPGSDDAIARIEA